MKYKLTSLHIAGNQFVAEFGDALHPNLVTMKSHPTSDIEISWSSTRTGAEGAQDMASNLFRISNAATALDYARLMRREVAVTEVLEFLGFNLDNLAE